MKRRLTVLLFVLMSFTGLSVALAQMEMGAKTETQTLKGEVVDLMCYLDHAGMGDKHSQCGTTCIESGGPVGLLTPDGKVYLIVGEHKPMNKELAPLCSKTVTLKGKVVERGGMRMIENAEIQK